MFHFVVFTALETVFAIMLLPEILERNQNFAQMQGSVAEQAVEAASPAPTEITPLPPHVVSPAAESIFVIISDKRFDARTIKWVMSQEHYISVKTFDEQIYFMRGRMRDFLVQVPEDMGYNIHRSHWIAWDAIRQVEVDKDNMLVEVDEKTILPVARGRRSDFISRWRRRTG